MDIFKQLEHLLLHDVELRLGGKVLKRGRLKLLNVKQHFIKFTLEVDNDIKSFELVYPFEIRVDSEKQCTLSYKISTFSGSNKDVFYKLKTLSKQTASPIYDNEITLISI